MIVVAVVVVVVIVVVVVAVFVVVAPSGVLAVFVGVSVMVCYVCLLGGVGLHLNCLNSTRWLR